MLFHAFLNVFNAWDWIFIDVIAVLVYYASELYSLPVLSVFAGSIVHHGDLMSSAKLCTKDWEHLRDWEKEMFLQGNASPSE